jgi:uncharacterized membrane protein
MAKDATLLVLAATYDDVQAAQRDYDMVKALFEREGIGHDFDASVIQRDAEGKSHVISKHEESTRHGLKWGLAVGAACAVFPVVGLVGGIAAGGAIGAAAGHVKGGMKDSDLKEVANTLDKGEAGLVVVYATYLKDQIDAAIKAGDTYVAEATDVDRATLDRQIAADISRCHSTSWA